MQFNDQLSQHHTRCSTGLQHRFHLRLKLGTIRSHRPNLRPRSTDRHRIINRIRVLSLLASLMSLTFQSSAQVTAQLL
jgi:hypothetical protein